MDDLELQEDAETMEEDSTCVIQDDAISVFKNHKGKFGWHCNLLTISNKYSTI
jgi:hypothetical protein